MSVCACVCERESERDVFFVRACACVCVACACSNYYRITESTCIHVRTLTVSQPATYLRSHSGRAQPLPKHPHTHAHIHVRTNNEQPRTITYTYTHTHVHTRTHAKIDKHIRTTTHTHIPLIYMYSYIYTSIDYLPKNLWRAPAAAARQYSAFLQVFLNVFDTCALLWGWSRSNFASSTTTTCICHLSFLRSGSLSVLAYHKSCF